MGEPGDLKNNGVNIVLKNPEGKYIFVRHNYGDRKLSLPGGGIKQGELSNRAIIRETREEAGLVVFRPILIADVQLFINWRHKVLLFTTAKYEGVPRADGNEISAIEFIAPAEVDAHPDIYPAQKKFIQIYEKVYMKLPIPVFALASDPPIIEW